MSKKKRGSIRGDVSAGKAFYQELDKTEYVPQNTDSNSDIPVEKVDKDLLYGLPVSSTDRYDLQDDFSIDEGRGRGVGTSLRNDDSLFDEESYIPGRLVEIKRFYSSSSCKWSVFIDGKKIFDISSTDLSEKARSFLKTPKGLTLLIGHVKNGCEKDIDAISYLESYIHNCENI